MSKQPAYISQMLQGTEPYGAPKNGVTLAAIQPMYANMPNVELVPFTAKAEYEACVAQKKNGDLCSGAAVMHTNLCFGHLKALANEVTPLKDGEIFDADKVLERAFPNLTQGE